MKVYVLENTELGYIDRCPTFEKREDAEREAAFKCRKHSVIEEELEYPVTGCIPGRLSRKCLSCALCAATVERRKRFIEKGLDI